MALSNIFNEPHKKITETLVGLLAFILFISPTCLIALYLNTIKDSDGNGCPIAVGIIIGFLTEVGLILLVISIHIIVEEICDNFDIRT